jgi:putative Mg2+ transporter-C (MgtC) family protein
MFLIISIDPLVNLFNLGFLNDLNVLTILIRLFLAVLCGGILGVERAIKHHAAGFRTYIIVCLGATIAMLTNEFINLAVGSTDAGRFGAQVISGIGFLGAGTIIVTSRNTIRGLTTAAGLWGCACLGLAIGVGFYTLALLGTLILTIVFAILPTIENFFTNRSRYFEIHIEFDTRENLKQFVGFARHNNLQISSIEHNSAYSSSGLSVYSIILKNLSKSKPKNHKDILEEFAKLPYVNFVEEIN